MPFVQTDNCVEEAEYIRSCTWRTSVNKVIEKVISGTFIVAGLLVWDMIIGVGLLSSYRMG